MAKPRDRITFRVGTRRETDIRLRQFLGKFPTDQWNDVARFIICACVEKAGTDWDPIADGFSGIFDGKPRPKPAAPAPPTPSAPIATPATYRPATPPAANRGIRNAEPIDEEGNKDIGLGNVLR